MEVNARNESTQLQEEFISNNDEIQLEVGQEYEIEVLDIDDNVLFVIKPKGIVAKFKIKKKNV